MIQKRYKMDDGRIQLLIKLKITEDKKSEGNGSDEVK